MKLGNIQVDVPIALAPMAGVTDLPFRVICKEMGAGYTISEMVSAKALLFKNVKTQAMLKIADKERPTAIQLFGSVPEELAEAAKIVEASGADIIDFNMGCPVPKIVSNGEGSALMQKPELAQAILQSMVQAVRIPVTVKLRAGWDEGHKNAPYLAQLAQEAGIAAVAIHGRTRSQFYSGKADWSIIKAVKESVQIPVFGNGDVFTARDGIRMLQETGCDGVMVGRGAEGNPWIFRALKDALEGKTVIEPITITERFTMMQRHLKDLIAFKGEKVALREMRHHGTAYIKGLPHAAAYKNKLNQLSSYQEFEELLAQYAILLKG